MIALPQHPVISIFDLARRVGHPLNEGDLHYFQRGTSSECDLRSLEVFNPLGLVEVSDVVNLEFLVDGGHLVLDGFLVLGVDESDLSRGAGVRGVHDEDELGLVTTILGLVLKVVDGVSRLIGRHGSLEVSEGGGTIRAVF